MTAITFVGRYLTTAVQRRSLDRTLAGAHPAVRDEVLTVWWSQTR